MARSIDAAVYANGDAIPHVTDPAEWRTLQTGAWTYYDNNPENGTIYSKLYNWYAINDSRELCPEGWRVASGDDWERLVAASGGADSAAAHLKATDYREAPEAEADSTPGFSALPGGNRRDDGGFNGIDLSAPFWTSDEMDSIHAFARYMNRAHSRMGKNRGDKRNGLAVRCVKDATR